MKCQRIWKMGKIRKRVLNLILSIFWAIVYFAYLLIFILVVFANFGYNDATIAIFSIMSTIIFVFVVREYILFYLKKYLYLLIILMKKFLGRGYIFTIFQILLKIFMNINTKIKKHMSLLIHQLNPQHQMKFINLKN